MSVSADAQPNAEGQQPPAEGTQEPPKPQTLEELLADLDDDRRTVILGEVDKARKEAKNLRTRVKEAEPKLAEYDRLVEASKTDAERAQEALQAAQDRASRATQRMAQAEVKAALSGLVDDPDAIIEDLNLAKFIGEDGEVNADAISALRSKYAAFGGRRAPRPDPSQASGANGKTQASPAADFASFIQSQIGSR